MAADATLIDNRGQLIGDGRILGPLVNPIEDIARRHGMRFAPETGFLQHPKEIGPSTYFFSAKTSRMRNFMTFASL